MMNIPSSYFIFLNVLIAIIYLLFIFLSYKKGFLYCLFHLFSTIGSVVLAWVLAPIVQKNINIISLKDAYTVIIETIVNQVLWFLILFIVIKIIFVVVSKILKLFSKIPVIGFINRILGILVGIVHATIVVLLLSMLLKTPIVSNSDEVFNNTAFKFVESYASLGFNYMIDNVDIDSMIDDLDIYDYIPEEVDMEVIEAYMQDLDTDSYKDLLKEFLKSYNISNE